MGNRRDFLKLGAAGAAGAWIGARAGIVGASAASTADGPLLTAAVFDPHQEESRAFAAMLDRAGIRTLAAGSDVATIWYPQLRELLRAAEAPVAGLTHRAVLFCLEELARDVGARLRYRIEHLIDIDGAVIHDPAGSEALVQATADLGRTAGFGIDAADLAMAQARNGTGSVRAQRRYGPGSPADGTVLVSWALA